MGKQVDDRVVTMEFDNAQFERNVNQSISTLDKLKNALHLDKSADALNQVGESAKRIDLNPLNSGLETASSKFREVAKVAAEFTVVSKVVDGVINKATQLNKAFVIEPVTTGLNEYEMKMTSVQTIMSSTGESVETVSKYLNELNKYSDETIYSFKDMTDNIGKFTSAGVKLDDAVLAIKGIANEAALSGANANEASRAMYNFSQALSSGYVKLIDWKSIENANMATKSFKDELLATAETMGTVNNVCTDKTGTLTDGNMKVDNLVSCSKRSLDYLKNAIGYILFITQDDNLTAKALKSKYSTCVLHDEYSSIPFESSKKFSAASFKKHTYALGAFGFLKVDNNKDIKKKVERYEQLGYRVLIIAEGKGDIKDNKMPNKMHAIGIITFSENIKPDAKQY